MNDCRRESDRGFGWRVLHVQCDGMLRAKYGRRQDAEKAARLLNEQCPCETGDKEIVKKELLARFGTLKAIRAYLVSRCCAW